MCKWNELIFIKHLEKVTPSINSFSHLCNQKGFCNNLQKNPNEPFAQPNTKQKTTLSLSTVHHQPLLYFSSFRFRLSELSITPTFTSSISRVHFSVSWTGLIRLLPGFASLLFPKFREQFLLLLFSMSRVHSMLLPRFLLATPSSWVCGCVLVCAYMLVCVCVFAYMYVGRCVPSHLFNYFSSVSCAASFASNPFFYLSFKFLFPWPFVFFLSLLLYTGIQLINNVVLGAQQSSSAIHIHVSIIPKLPSHPGCHTTLSRVPCAV